MMRAGRMLAMLAAAAILSSAGCGSRPRPEAATAAIRPSAVPPASRAAREKILEGAMAVLTRLDDFAEDRAYEQVFDRLNQWNQLAVPPAGWRLDPLVSTLPEDLRSAAADCLDRDVFAAPEDVLFVRDRCWLAGIARAARGDAIDDLAVAERLFAWTVRSLALVSDPPMTSAAKTAGSRWLLPGEILLAGRASAAQRAWIFLELLRQAGIDGVMLATGDAESGTLRPWLPAVISGGEAFLFEPTYGMAVPGPEGRGVATVRQAADSSGILEALSLPDRPYPVRSADMRGLVVLVAADPRALSRRMAALDGDLVAKHGVRLAIDASGLALRAAAAIPDSDAAARLWEFPWQTLLRRAADPAALMSVLQRELASLEVVMSQPPPAGRGPPRLVRPLFVARVRDFRGDVAGPEGAKAAYLAARPGRQVIAAATAELPPEQAEAAARLFASMKEDATYWLGLATLAEGEAEAAVDYLERMTLEATPDGRWTDAARVNLAQAFLQLGRSADAVRVLREDGSPQRFGSRLLADRLDGMRAER